MHHSELKVSPVPCSYVGVQAPLGSKRVCPVVGGIWRTSFLASGSALFQLRGWVFLVLGAFPWLSFLSKHLCWSFADCSIPLWQVSSSAPTPNFHFRTSFSSSQTGLCGLSFKHASRQQTSPTELGEARIQGVSCERDFMQAHFLSGAFCIT